MRLFKDKRYPGKLFTRTSLPIGVMELTDEQSAFKYRRCVRHGKTRRDHNSGAWHQRFANHQQRISDASSKSSK